MQFPSAVALAPVAIIFGLLCGSTAQSAAQERLPPLQKGEPVRVTSNLLPGRSVFIFEEFRADTLLAVGRSGASVGLPLSRIQQLETAHKDRLRGALIGAPAGAILLTTVLTIFMNSQGGWMIGGDFGDDLVFSAILGLPIGGVLGAIAGGVIGITRWTPVAGSPPRR